MGAPADGSVQQVDWSIESTRADAPADDEGLARLRARLDGDGRLRAVELNQSDGEVHLRCIVKARGAGPAVMTVAEVFGGDSTWCVGPVRRRASP